MSIILTIDANPEKLQERLMRFFMTIRRRLAIRVTQICILMALALSPWKYLSGKFCFNGLNSYSISHLWRYMSMMSSTSMVISLVSNDMTFAFFFAGST